MPLEQGWLPLALGDLPVSKVCSLGRNHTPGPRCLLLGVLSRGWEPTFVLPEDLLSETSSSPEWLWNGSVWFVFISFKVMN